MPGDADDTTMRVVADATCLGCGCLCDDIEVAVSGQRIVEARHACELGLAWFQARRAESSLAEATIDGRSVSPDRAVDHAARLLLASTHPIVIGLDGSTLEAQAAAVAVADGVGASIDPGHSLEAAPGLAAFQRVGMVGASLGEVRNRADVLIFWGVDPATTHPRHFERYSVDPVGRFVPQGRSGRTILVVDAAPSATTSRADRVLLIAPDRWFETLHVLRALTRGLMIDADAVKASCGVTFETLRSWHQTMVQARYGVFFHGKSLGQGRGGSATVQEALELVRDLNAHTRFVALTLGGPGNPTGAEAVLSWQLGSPLALDLGRGYPRFLPGEATAEARLASGEADAAVIVGAVPTGLSPGALHHLAAITRIWIGERATDPASGATVGMAASRTGIESGGTVMRCDGVTLPLRPSLGSSHPSERAWLESIGIALKSSRT